VDRLDAARAAGALLLDVREPAEFASGHVPGAVNLPLGRVAAEAHRFAGRSVCVICRSGQRSLRAAALLNGHGKPADETVKVSRGDLALRAAYTGEGPGADLSRYDPFHLVLADLGQVLMWSWNGERLTTSPLPAGTSMVVNSGLDPESERVAAYLPRFRAAEDWSAFAAEPPSGDRGALIIRRELPDGRVFASLSVMRVSIAPEGVTYDFTDLTADQDR